MAYEQHVVTLPPPSGSQNTPLSSGVGFFHDFVTQSPTFEVSIDACEWQTSVPQFENDVGAGEEGGKDARELRHMSRIPRLGRW